jgi:preprotein translocase subunit SecY
MKSLIKNLRNIWKIEELKSRIIQTIILVAVYRLGSFIILPGINSKILAEQTAKGGNNILDIINAFTGGAFANASIFALGIMPYISASIIVQLLGIAVPYFQKLQKDGESGRKKINQITRALTVIITAAQAPGYLSQYVPAAARPDNVMWWVLAITILIAGTIFVMWLGERITDRGLGNGISLIIMIGIIANLPQGLLGEFVKKNDPSGGGLVLFLMEMVILLAIIVISILLVQGTRRIDIHFAKKVVTTKQGAKQYGGHRSYLPLKVNAAGVMPIIFAQAIMFVPVVVAGFATEGSNIIVRTFSDYTSFWYNFTFAVLIVLFTYFYTAISVNPQSIADELKRNGGFIQGKKPGKETAEFIDNVLSRITLPGSLFLAFVAILPSLASKFNVNPAFAQFFGGTSLLILVGVVLDTLAQIDSHLKMRQYDGLMKGGRIKGRAPMGMVGQY